MISTNLVNLSIGPIADHLDELEDPCRILESRVTAQMKKSELTFRAKFVSLQYTLQKLRLKQRLTRKEARSMLLRLVVVKSLAIFHRFLSEFPN